MAKVLFTSSLLKKIKRTFSPTEAHTIIDHLNSLEDHPKKGKPITRLGRIIVKEVKYLKYRFYFITNGFIVKFGAHEELATLVIKYVRMSEKKDQQDVIAEIKKILAQSGETGFE